MKNTNKYHAFKVKIKGAGVAHVNPIDILKSDEGKRQLEALKKLKERPSNG